MQRPGRGPGLALEDVQTDLPGIELHVGMEDLGLEADGGRRHGVLDGNVDGQQEGAALVEGAGRAADRGGPAAQLVGTTPQLDVLVVVALQLLLLLRQTLRTGRHQTDELSYGS